MRAGLIGAAAAAAALAALATPRGEARADPLPDTIQIDPGPSWGERLADKMTLAGDTVGTHLRAVSFDSLDLKFDGHSKIAHLNLRRDAPGGFSLTVDGDVKFLKGYARVDATLQLGVMGRSFKLDLPEFDMVPRSYEGHRWVELRLPLVDLKF